MDQKHSGTFAYHDQSFLDSREARELRILAEYLEPKARFDRERIDDTIVIMGSARIMEPAKAEAMLEEARTAGADTRDAEQRLKLSAYYEHARELAYRLTEWSKGLDDPDRRFVICTGGGPGIMEAANRGASEARGLNVGLTISIPTEEFDNPYITHDLNFLFHYFFMRKYWFAYLAKAVVFFPGGFGTLDELFEILTLRQTGKMKKHLPLVLFGTDYWSKVLNLEALAEAGTINHEDLDLIHPTDSVDDAFSHITAELDRYARDNPGAVL